MEAKSDGLEWEKYIEGVFPEDAKEAQVITWNYDLESPDGRITSGVVSEATNWRSGAISNMATRNPGV